MNDIGGTDTRSLRISQHISYSLWSVVSSIIVLLRRIYVRTRVETMSGRRSDVELCPGETISRTYTCITTVFELYMSHGLASTTS